MKLWVVIGVVLAMYSVHSFSGETEGGESAANVEAESKTLAIVKGQVLNADGMPVSNQKVDLQVYVGGDVDDIENNYRRYNTITDKDGQFVFENVDSGSVHIGRRFQAESMAGIPYGLNHSFEVRGGKEYSLTLAGQGRPVIGRLVPVSGNKDDIDWSAVKVYLHLEAAPFSMGFGIDDNKIFRKMVESEGADLYSRKDIQVNNDGTFWIENVRAGRYMFRVKLPDDTDRFNLLHNFTVNLMRDGFSKETLNLGDLIVSHDNYNAPVPVDNICLGWLTLDKDMPVRRHEGILSKDMPIRLQAGTDQEPVVVSAKSIRFEKEGDFIKAVLEIEWESIADATWQATLSFLSQNGSVLNRSDVFFNTSKSTEEITLLHSEEMNFILRPLSDLSIVNHYALMIQPVNEELESAVMRTQLGTATH